VLVACLLSLRTKDETTGPAAARLFALADTPEGIRRLTARAIERAIYPVGFYRTKARVLREISRDLLARFGGAVPDDIDALLTLKGVGRKTANLVVTQGFNKPGICVDVHVHRISNRWGYVKTRTPEETEMALRRALPAATGSATTICSCPSARTSACPSRPAARRARSVPVAPGRASFTPANQGPQRRAAARGGGRGARLRDPRAAADRWRLERHGHPREARSFISHRKGSTPRWPWPIFS
jgi:endonuclease-3